MVLFETSGDWVNIKDSRLDDSDYYLEATKNAKNKKNFIVYSCVEFGSIVGGISMLKFPRLFVKSIIKRCVIIAYLWSYELINLLNYYEPRTVDQRSGRVNIGSALDGF